MVVERHSEWEPTTKPYDTTWFVEPKLFRRELRLQLRRHLPTTSASIYEMSRLLEKDKIDDQTLAKCDVLVIKIPTDALQPGRSRRRWCGSSSRAAGCC